MIDDTILILPAGGASARFGGGCKLFALLKERPVFTHALATLAPLFPPGRIILAVPPAFEPEFRRLAARFLPDAVLRFVSGGASRTESVRNALRFAASEFSVEAVRYAAIHDAARPFLTRELFERTLSVCRERGGAVLCRTVTDTVKRLALSGAIAETLPRETLALAETPQIFPLRPLLAACDAALASGEPFTDDAQVMARFGGVDAVAVLHDGADNRKITFRGDLAE